MNFLPNRLGCRSNGIANTNLKHALGGWSDGEGNKEVGAGFLQNILMVAAVFGYTDHRQIGTFRPLIGEAFPQRDLAGPESLGHFLVDDDDTGDPDPSSSALSGTSSSGSSIDM